MDKNSLWCFLVRETRPTDPIGDNVRASNDRVLEEITRYSTAAIIGPETAERLIAIWNGYKFAVGVSGQPWYDHSTYAGLLGQHI